MYVTNRPTEQSFVLPSPGFRGDVVLKMYPTQTTEDGLLPRTFISSLLKEKWNPAHNDRLIAN